MHVKSGKSRPLALLFVVTAVAVGAPALASVDYEWPLTGPTTVTFGPPTPTNVTASTTAVGYDAANVCNNTGMSSTIYPQDRHDAVGANMWMSTANDPDVFVQVDLGATYALGKMAIWNFNQFSGGVSYAGRGARYCYIGSSLDGTYFSWLDGGHGFGGLFELAKASVTGADIGPTNRTDGPNSPVDFKGVPGRYVRLGCYGNWGGAPGDGSDVYHALSEIRIYRYASTVASAGNFIAAKTLEASTADVPAESTTNNYGMSDAGTGTYTSAATANTASGWSTTIDDPDPYILYDLGGTYPLDKMYVWNYNAAYFVPLWGRGIKHATIYYALANPGYNPDDIYGAYVGWTKLVGPNADQTWTFDPASSSTTQGYTNVFSFGNVPVRYVMIVPNVGMNDGNWGGAYADTAPYYGLSQVRFHAGPGLVAEPNPWWTGVMGQRSAMADVWAGADGGFSIPYTGPGGAARSLFTFSDTNVGKWNPTTYERIGDTLPPNTNAVWSGTATSTPALSNMAFDTSHTLVADPARWPSQFFWLNSGIFIPGHSKIYLLGPRIQQGTNVHVGNAMIALPLSSGVIQWGSQAQYDTGFFSTDPVTGRNFSFAHAVLDRSAQEGYLYIYGSMTDPDPFIGHVSSAIVARCTPGNITRFSSWRFYNGTSWVPGYTNAAPISPDSVGLTTSVGLAYDAAHAGQIMMATNSYSIGELMIGYAANPWGPFNTWTTVYAPPENNVDWYDGGVWWYATAYHPQLSVSGEALLSYSINTQHFADPYYFNSDVYHPRFVRVRQIQ